MNKETTARDKPFRTVGEIDPEKDGIDYINIYSQCVTRLGQRLSHFARSKFVHPYFGPFESMEGFWFYMRTGRKYDKLRYLYGLRAKRAGKELPMVHNPNFQEDILAGNYQKIIQDEGLTKSFRDSDLPLTHFYLFWPKGENPQTSQMKPVIIFPRNSDWLIDGMEEIRRALKANEVPEFWTNAAKRYVAETTDGV